MTKAELIKITQIMRGQITNRDRNIVSKNDQIASLVQKKDGLFRTIDGLEEQVEALRIRLRQEQQLVQTNREFHEREKKTMALESKLAAAEGYKEGVNDIDTILNRIEAIHG